MGNYSNTVCWVSKRVDRSLHQGEKRPREIALLRGRIGVIKRVIGDGVLTFMWVFYVSTVETFTYLISLVLGVQALPLATIFITIVLIFVLVFVFNAIGDEPQNCRDDFKAPPNDPFDLLRLVGKLITLCGAVFFASRVRMGGKRVNQLSMFLLYQMMTAETGFNCQQQALR